MSTLRERLGLLLQQRRHQRGDTQEELAERADLSPKYLGEVERGEANVTISALERIAAALKWDLGELFSAEPTQISRAVHERLVSELRRGRDGQQMLIDWLEALDLTGRGPLPALMDRLPPNADTVSLSERGCQRRSRRVPRQE